MLCYSIWCYSRDTDGPLRIHLIFKSNCLGLHAGAILVLRRWKCHSHAGLRALELKSMKVWL